MKKKIFITLLFPLLILLLFFGTYKLIKTLDYKNSISKLEQHNILEDEKIVKQFKYKSQQYTITKYYDNTSSWSHINFLIQNNNKYYILESVKKCDLDDESSNLYVKDNEIYIHCIGKIGNIDKYSINNFNIEKEAFTLNYKNTPNISQLHIGIEKVDNEFVYLYSAFKVDNTIKEKPRVKCSLKNKICNYY